MRYFDLAGRWVYIGLFKCNEAIADAQCNKTLDSDLAGRWVYIGLFKCNEAIADAQCNKTLDSECMCYSPTGNHSSKVRI